MQTSKRREFLRKSGRRRRKIEAEKQRCLRFKTKNQFEKYKAFTAYAQRKSPGLVREFEAGRAPAEPTDPEPPTAAVVEPVGFIIKTPEAAT